jgi:hypothetical protein
VPRTAAAIRALTCCRAWRESLRSAAACRSCVRDYETAGGSSSWRAGRRARGHGHLGPAINQARARRAWNGERAMMRQWMALSRSSR